MSILVHKTLKMHIVDLGISYREFYKSLNILLKKNQIYRISDNENINNETLTFNLHQETLAIRNGRELTILWDFNNRTAAQKNSAVMGLCGEIETNDNGNCYFNYEK